MAVCLLITVPAICERLGTAGCTPPVLPGPPRPHQVCRQKQPQQARGLKAGASGPVPTLVPPASALTAGGEKPAAERANIPAPGNNLSLVNPPQRGRTARASASPSLQLKRVFQCILNT